MRWTQQACRKSLASLAYRLDDIKRHIGGMGESPAVRALEDKLIAIATAMEQFGSMIQPHDRAMAEQFAAMDMRLDEISRAIAASGRSAASGDPALMHRLEGRLNALAEQIDMVGRSAESHALPAEGLAERLEMLTRRVEELANTKATARLDERLEQLSFMLERAQKTVPQADLNGTLAGHLPQDRRTGKRRSQRRAGGTAGRSCPPHRPDGRAACAWRGYR